MAETQKELAGDNPASSFLNAVNAADEAAFKSQVAFLNGPEAYRDYIMEQGKEIMDRLEKQYEQFRMDPTATRTG